MGRKKENLFSTLWNAWKWATGIFLHLFYLLAKGVVFALHVFSDWLSGPAKKSVLEVRRMAGISQAPFFSPLSLQKKISGDLEDFEDSLLSSKSKIGLIFGVRGSGKSGLGMRILENVHAKTGRKVCALGFPESTLPGWISWVGTVEGIPNGSFVLVDEGGISFSSRSSFSSANKVLSSLLFISRHKDISVLFISQNSANLEINAIRQADYLFLRKPSLLQQDFERKRIGEIYSRILKGFSSLPEKGKYSTYIYSDEFQGFAGNALPSFWSTKVSKGFSEKRMATKR